MPSLFVRTTKTDQTAQMSDGTFSQVEAHIYNKTKTSKRGDGKLGIRTMKP